MASLHDLGSDLLPKSLCSMRGSSKPLTTEGEAQQIPLCLNGLRFWQLKGLLRRPVQREQEREREGGVIWWWPLNGFNGG